MFQSSECHGRCVLRKLPLAAVGLVVWKGRSLEVKRPGGELVMEIKVRESGILGLGDLVMPPTELVVTGAGTDRSLSRVEWRTL